MCHYVGFLLIGSQIMDGHKAKVSGVVWYVSVLSCKVRAGKNGPAAPVLVGPVFLKVKMKFNFT